MSNQDVRREQIALLRFEKELTSIAETLAEGEKVAMSTDQKVGSSDASAAYAEMKDALLKLAEVTENAHETLRIKALNAKRSFIDTNLGKSFAGTVESKLSRS